MCLWNACARKNESSTSAVIAWLLIGVGLLGLASNDELIRAASDVAEVVVALFWWLPGEPVAALCGLLLVLAGLKLSVERA